MGAHQYRSLYGTTNWSDNRGVKESQRMEPKLDRVMAIQKSEYDRDLPMSGAR